MTFRSAYGCCSRCRRIVSVQASTLAEAAGSVPYRHKEHYGTDEPWCDGHHYPALHFTESNDLEAVEDIKQGIWDRLECFAERKKRRKKR